MLVLTRILVWTRGTDILLPVSCPSPDRLQETNAKHYPATVLLFYVTYIFFELPSNMALKRVGAPRWLAGLAALFGLSTLGVGLAQNYATLLALRIVLGTMEAVC